MTEPKSLAQMLGEIGNRLATDDMTHGKYPCCGFEAGYRHSYNCEHKRVGMIEMAKVLSIAVRLAEACEQGHKTLEWYANEFKGWEDSPHEFEHFWRVELPHEFQTAKDECTKLLKGAE